MTLDWQTILTVVLVAWASFFVARSLWKTLKAKAAGCGSCGCASGKKSEPGGSSLIPSESLRVRKPPLKL